MPAHGGGHFPFHTLRASRPSGPVADGTDWIPLTVSAVAIIFAALTWWESRRLRQLAQTLFKTLPFLMRSRRKAANKPARDPAKPVAVKAAAEERRRLKLELEREKLEWRRNRDIAKAIGWFLDRMGDDEYDDEVT